MIHLGSIRFFLHFFQINGNGLEVVINYSFLLNKQISPAENKSPLPGLHYGCFVPRFSMCDQNRAVELCVTVPIHNEVDASHL